MPDKHLDILSNSMKSIHGMFVSLNMPKAHNNSVCHKNNDYTLQNSLVYVEKFDPEISPKVETDKIKISFNKYINMLICRVIQQFLKFQILLPLLFFKVLQATKIRKA